MVFGPTNILTQNSLFLLKKVTFLKQFFQKNVFRFDYKSFIFNEKSIISKLRVRVTRYPNKIKQRSTRKSLRQFALALVEFW